MTDTVARKQRIVATVKHPAKFSGVVVTKIREILDLMTADWPDVPVVLDPMGGVGGIHWLRRNADGTFAQSPCYDTIAVEIEREWANVSATHGPTICRDFFQFEWDRERWGGGPDFICTSPTYGNRCADKHRARDGSVRRSYTHDLGRDLSANNSGGMQWGKDYRKLHRRLWQRCYGMLDSGGHLILNVSDHIRDRKVVPVALWHHDTLLDVGFELVQEHDVATQRMRMGENHEARVDCEKVFVVRKPENGSE